LAAALPSTPLTTSCFSFPRLTPLLPAVLAEPCCLASRAPRSSRALAGRRPGRSRDHTFLSSFPSLLQTRHYYKPDQNPLSLQLLCSFFLLATPSRRRCSSPGSSPTAPPRPNSLDQLLPHPLPQLLDLTQPSPRLPSAGIALTPSRRSPEPPELDLVVDSFLHLISSPSRCTNRFLVTYWCSCALPLLVFTGPSPGTPESRRGRRTFLSSAMSHRRPSSTLPPNALPGSCRSCLARPPRWKARRRREHI
jgi:hypothetical protein